MRKVGAFVAKLSSGVFCESCARFVNHDKEIIMRRLLSSVLAGVLIAGCASMTSGAPVKLVGGVLTGPNGMTLYTFDRDTQPGKSVCNGPCAANWPPLFVNETDPSPTGDYSVITRDDGRKQWALKGKPLYFWSKDTQPGDQKGEGVINAWHVAKP